MGSSPTLPNTERCHRGGYLQPLGHRVCLLGPPVDPSRICPKRGFKPKSFALGRVFCFCAPVANSFLAAQRRFRKKFRPQNNVFTPHFLSEITSVRVVYGVNRNLLIEISPLVPLD